MGNSHRGVIETSAPPSLSLIASGPEDLCRGALAAWVAEHPLGEFDEAVVLQVVP